MNIVRCGGKNLNQVPFREFKEQFISYCRQYGRIYDMKIIGNQMILAQVIGDNQK